jgi:serine/threonine protein kinase
MNPSVRVVCRGCLRSVEKRSGAEGSDPARCPFCGDLLDSRAESSQANEVSSPDWPDPAANAEAPPGGTSQSPTQICERIDWVKTWAQGSLGSLGRFQLRERMGDGGFGSVFRAYDPRLDRDVAIKVLKQPHPTERMMERFFREARAVARLDHPNIVGVYDAGFDDGRSWVAYQLVSGRPLWWYREHHPMDPATCARIIRALADALDHSHSLGVVHRDLKPSNVIIDDRGQPRLIDFGLARRSDLESDLTRDGAILGTPAYMSPEQALGRSRQVDERTDVYSLGVIFYELLTGHHPDEPSTASSDPPARLKTDRRGLRALRRAPRAGPSVPRALRPVCLKAMAINPDERYPTARALADQLDLWLTRQQRLSDRVRLFLSSTAVGLCLSVALVMAIKLVLGAAVKHAELPDPNVLISPLFAGSARGANEPVLVPPGESRFATGPPKQSSAPPESPRKLIGNASTYTYHAASCRHVVQLAKTRQVQLASAEEALQQGYKPCKDCNPPVVHSPSHLDSPAESNKKR